jgi:hypothetical protein
MKHEYSEQDIWDILRKIMHQVKFNAERMTPLSGITLRGHDVDPEEFFDSIENIEWEVKERAHAFSLIEETDTHRIYIARVQEEYERVSIEFKLAPDAISIFSNGYIDYKRGEPNE